MKEQSLAPEYRGTSRIRNTPLLGSYSRTIPRVLRWSWGGGLSLMSEVLLQVDFVCVFNDALEVAAVVDGTDAVRCDAPPYAAIPSVRCLTYMYIYIHAYICIYIYI